MTHQQPGRGHRGGRRTMKVLTRLALPIEVEVGSQNDIVLKISDITYAVDTSEALRLAHDLADAVTAVKAEP